MRTHCPVCRGKGTIADPECFGQLVAYCGPNGERTPHITCPNCQGEKFIGSSDVTHPARLGAPMTPSASEPTPFDRKAAENCLVNHQVPEDVARPEIRWLAATLREVDRQKVRITELEQTYEQGEVRIAELSARVALLTDENERLRTLADGAGKLCGAVSGFDACILDLGHLGDHQSGTFHHGKLLGKQWP